MQPKKPFTTSAVCKAAQVTRGQLRTYERLGLIAPPERLSSGYRNYPPDTVDRLFAIGELQDCGLSLAEISILLSQRDVGAIDYPKIIELATDQLHKLDARIAKLQLLRTYIAAVAGGDITALNDPNCNLLIDFLTAGTKPSSSKESQ